MKILKSLLLSLTLLVVASCSSLSLQSKERALPWDSISALPESTEQWVFPRQFGTCLVQALKYPLKEDSYVFFVGQTRNFIVMFFPQDGEIPSYIWYGEVDKEGRLVVKGREFDEKVDVPEKWDSIVCADVKI